jgi:hypothetical protein
MRSLLVSVVEADEIDDLGHMNVQHYPARHRPRGGQTSRTNGSIWTTSTALSRAT